MNPSATRIATGHSGARGRQSAPRLTWVNDTTTAVASEIQVMERTTQEGVLPNGQGETAANAISVQSAKWAEGGVPDSAARPGASPAIGGSL